MKTALERLAGKVRRGEALPAPVGALLSAATVVTRLAMARRLHQARVRVDARVISFGNLTAGGTGKTPAVIERAEAEVAAGRRVAVLTRGYGSARVREPHFATAEDDPRAVCERVGDEPALILRRVPGVVVVKSADRVAGARAAIARHGCDTLLLDDGFQAVRLDREENVLVVDATNPFGNGRLVPRGILREPPAGAARATHVVLTRCDQARDLAGLRTRLAALCPGAPVRLTRHAPQRLWRVATGEELPLETLRGHAVTAACAIGNPEAFVATLRGLGAEVTALHTAADHAMLTPKDLASDGPCIVTEKDAVRLADAPAHVLALGIGLADWEGEDG